jgi:hypothetical protein
MPVRGLLLFLLCIARFSAVAQAIRGEVLDNEDKRPVAGVVIENIHTSLSISTDNNGSFLIAAAGGQLLEFRKPGFKTTRVRVPMGYIPSFFRIIMKKGLPVIQEVEMPPNRYDYRRDSIRYHELYKHELEFPKLSGFDMIAHPFSAMSSRNREIWQFQEDYEEFEKEKYVDRTFNAALITKFTGLKGDSLRTYMRRYRPSYPQLRSMNDYTFFNFIKTSVKYFRNADSPRGAQ